MNNLTIEFGRKPLVIAIWTGPPTDEEFMAYLRILSENLHAVIKARTKTALVIDSSRQSQPSSARQRQMQAAWLKEHSAALRAGCVGMAFVIQSPLIRGAMTAVLWLQGLPYPHTVLGSRTAAEQWCTERLLEAGVAVPAAI